MFPKTRFDYALTMCDEEVVAFLAPWATEPVYTKLGSGGFAQVFDLGGGKVARLSRDFNSVLPEHPLVNQRHAYQEFTYEGVYGLDSFFIEVFPKVDEFLAAANVPWSEQIQVRLRIGDALTKDAIGYDDLHGLNIGRKKGGPWIITDPGCAFALNLENY